jgi:hypothetical protein
MLVTIDIKFVLCGTASVSTYFWKIFFGVVYNSRIVLCLVSCAFFLLHLKILPCWILAGIWFGNSANILFSSVYKGAFISIIKFFPYI